MCGEIVDLSVVSDSSDNEILSAEATRFILSRRAYDNPSDHMPIVPSKGDNDVASDVGYDSAIDVSDNTDFDITQCDNPEDYVVIGVDTPGPDASEAVTPIWIHPACTAGLLFSSSEDESGCANASVKAPPSTPVTPGSRTAYTGAAILQALCDSTTPVPTSPAYTPEVNEAGVPLWIASTIARGGDLTGLEKYVDRVSLYPRINLPDTPPRRKRSRSPVIPKVHRRVSDVIRRSRYKRVRIVKSNIIRKLSYSCNYSDGSC